MGWIALSVVVLFQGLRWRTGTDWIPHYEWFSYANTNSEMTDVEPGYLYLNKVIALFTKNYTVFLLISCFLNLWLVRRFARYLGIDNIAAIILVTFSGAIFPVRIQLAVSIFLQAYQYIIEKKFLKYLLVVLLAASFHGAALITIPFYLIAIRSFSYKELISIYVISCLVGFSVTPVLEGLNAFFSLGVFESSDYAVEKINGNFEYASQAEASSFTSMLMSLINGAFFISLFGLIRNKYYRNIWAYDVLFSLYVFGLSFNRIVINAMPYLSRVAAFFAGGFSVMLLLWIGKQKKEIRLILVCIMAVYYFFIYRRILIGELSDLFIPYYSIFSDGQRPSVY